MKQARAAILGAGGFIGSHLVRRLKAEGFWVRGVDRKAPDFSPSAADEFVLADLRRPAVCAAAVKGCAEVYQLAADMGGMGFIEGRHDADIVHNSALINLHVAEAASRAGVARLFFSSSACVYPRHHQLDPARPECREETAYPADPDSEYGWEKLFAERLYQTYQRRRGLNVRIARLHNVFGPEGTWRGGREKAPAALCRKVAQAPDGGQIDVWGAGDQTRSFLYIDECLEGIRRLMQSPVKEPLNIGSAEMISINALARLVIHLSGKRLTIRNVPGPEGVRGRTSDNRRILALLGWAPSAPLRQGIAVTYQWIARQVHAQPTVSVRA